MSSVITQKSQSSLDVLLAIECHGSIDAAAMVLKILPSEVREQIKHLETQIQVRLIEESQTIDDLKNEL